MNTILSIYCIETLIHKKSLSFFSWVKRVKKYANQLFNVKRNFFSGCKGKSKRCSSSFSTSCRKRNWSNTTFGTTIFIIICKMTLVKNKSVDNIISGNISNLNNATKVLLSKKKRAIFAYLSWISWPFLDLQTKISWSHQYENLWGHASSAHPSSTMWTTVYYSM